MSQTTHFYDVKFLAWYSGSVKFWTNIISVRFTHLLEDFGQKSVFGSKTVIFGHYYMVYPADTTCGAFSQQIWPGIFPHSACVKLPVALTVVYIAYYTELDLQICNYSPKRRICRVYSNENFCGHFCSRRKAANFCHSVYKEFRNSHATLRHKPKGPLNWLYFVRKVQDCVLQHPMRKHLLPWKKKVGGHKWKRFIKHFSLDRPSLPLHRWNYVPV